MRRREFIKSVVAVGGLSALGKGVAFGAQLSQYMPPPELQVKRVLVMFKCHFDAGFIDTQKAVVHWYFADYFPQAIRIANDMRRTGGHPYVWTTGSWLLYEYLEQASTEERRRMEKAIADGDIAWHALPFSWQTELMDPSMIAGSIGLSHSLDRRFGTTTTGAKMTDVPGHTRPHYAPSAGRSEVSPHWGEWWMHASRGSSIIPVERQTRIEPGGDVSPRLWRDHCCARIRPGDCCRRGGGQCRAALAG